MFYIVNIKNYSICIKNYNPNPSFIKKIIKECDDDEEVYVDTT